MGAGRAAFRGLLGAAVFATLFGLAPAAAAAGDDACWQIIYKAVYASANAPHARYVTYDERGAILADGTPLQYIRSSITYRDDGLAYVDDDRWGEPFVSTSLEPGPPVMGPYGDARNAWLSFESDATGLPLIARVHSAQAKSCRVAGIETIHGSSAYDVKIGENEPHSTGVRTVWIDTRSFGIRRVVVRGPLDFYVTDAGHEAFADYRVDVEQAGPYTVVRRVTWQYREREYDQWTNFDAQYDFADYHFSQNAPQGSPLALKPTLHR